MALSVQVRFDTASQMRIRNAVNTQSFCVQIAKGASDLALILNSREGTILLFGYASVAGFCSRALQKSTVSERVSTIALL